MNLDLTFPTVKSMMSDPAQLLPIAIGVGIIVLVVKTRHARVWPALAIAFAGVLLSSTFIGVDASAVWTALTKHFIG